MKDFLSAASAQLDGSTVKDSNQSLPLFARAFQMEAGWRELAPRLSKAGLLPDDNVLIARIVGASR